MTKEHAYIKYVLVFLPNMFQKSFHLEVLLLHEMIFHVKRPPPPQISTSLDL